MELGYRPRYSRTVSPSWRGISSWVECVKYIRVLWVSCEVVMGEASQRSTKTDEQTKTSSKEEFRARCPGLWLPNPPHWEGRQSYVYMFANLCLCKLVLSDARIPAIKVTAGFPDVGKRRPFCFVIIAAVIALMRYCDARETTRYCNLLIPRIRRISSFWCSFVWMTESYKDNSPAQWNSFPPGWLNHAHFPHSWNADNKHNNREFWGKTSFGLHQRDGSLAPSVNEQKIRSPTSLWKSEDLDTRAE
jgi:hypothetical protein